MPSSKSPSKLSLPNPDGSLTPRFDRDGTLQVYRTPETDIASSHYAHFRTLLNQIDQSFVQKVNELFAANAEIAKLSIGLPSALQSDSAFCPEVHSERTPANSHMFRPESDFTKTESRHNDYKKCDTETPLDNLNDCVQLNRAKRRESKRHSRIARFPPVPYPPGAELASASQRSEKNDLQESPSENHRRLVRSLTELRKTSVGETNSRVVRFSRELEDLSRWRRCVLRVVSSSYYEGFFSLCIIVNAVTIGMEAEHSLTNFFSYPRLFDYAESFFVIVFTFELLSRYVAFGLPKAMANAWVRFDSLCVSCGLLDMVFRLFLHPAASDVLSKVIVLRILRLARLARAVRLFVQFRTLWLLIIGMRASITTVLWTFVLIFSISYIFAVLGMETIAPLEESHNEHFQTIALDSFGCIVRAMLTLLQTLTLDSVYIIYRPLIEESKGIYQLYIIAYFLTFVMFISIAAMNLVTAIMVEGSMQQASEDKEALRRWQEQKRKALLPRLRSMFVIIDADDSGEVTYEELQSAPPELLETLQALTQTADLAEFFYLVDEDGSGSVNIDEFLEAVVNCSSAEAVHSLKVGRLMKQSDKMNAILHELDMLKYASK